MMKNKVAEEMAQKSYDYVCGFVDENSTQISLGIFADHFFQSIMDEVLTICEEGDKTQTTSGGIANLIKQRFGL